MGEEVSFSVPPKPLPAAGAPEGWLERGYDGLIIHQIRLGGAVYVGDIDLLHSLHIFLGGSAALSGYCFRPKIS